MDSWKQYENFKIISTVSEGVPNIYLRLKNNNNLKKKCIYFLYDGKYLFSNETDTLNMLISVIVIPASGKI